MASTELAIHAIALAVQIAFRTKQNAMKTKGRPFSQRAMRQWEKTTFSGEVHTILSEQFKFARWLVPEDNADARLRIVVHELAEDWKRVCRSVGRPKRKIGLINDPKSFAAEVKEIGRPRSIPKEELQGLVAFVEGVRWKSYMRKEGFGGFADAYRYIASAPKAEIKNELIRAASDADSIQLLLSRDSKSLPNLPRDPIKLRATLRNARRTFNYQPPPPKVGGNSR